jgi:hypothetical protein
MSKTTFAYWWRNIGSGMIPGKDEEQEQHAERVAKAAWDGAIENSAAPDLLEALDTLTHVIGLTPIAGNKQALQEAFDAAAAAIAKAEGRAK